MKDIAKIYEFSEAESRLYEEWMLNGYFKAKIASDSEPFVIVMPPPNVTGQLHMGHALDDTLQDILVRVKRMQGYSTLWLPGIDHAGIATQVKVEEEIKNKEGLSRHDLGREEFLKRVWRWKDLYGNDITNQLRKLGASCDWSRERFTMDEGCSRAVRHVFVNLYEKKLIYRGERIINWCPHCVTALSDAEINYEEKSSSLWHVKYDLCDDEKDAEFVVIATTRPETIFGDVAVAVHPQDVRYKHLVGKFVKLPLTDRKIPIISDEYVDKDFGTGAVKITPAHDINDFDVGQRHGLNWIKIFDDYAFINDNGGSYKGLERYQARSRVIDDLAEQRLLIKTENHTHNVAMCYRCGTAVEPIVSKQWFVKMKPLAAKAIKVVKDGKVKFVPEKFCKTYLDWMENIRDWCVSRQLWWGHRIPAFYCDNCGAVEVSMTDLATCPKCGGAVTQDDDVLDTWFSSALWPFSALGFPDKTDDLKYFYPTTVLVTGYDIIFFWVARMIVSAMEHMDKEPFEYVFVHGLVRDSEGRKMSKSLGNGVNPLEVIEKYGADALRFTLATGNAPGNDMRFYWEKVEASRNFANKIWNASRFVIKSLAEPFVNMSLGDCQLAIEDKWVLHRYNTLVGEVTRNINKFELGVAAQKLYDFIWDEFCDWYIELVKPRLLNSKDEVAMNVLVFVLSNTLKLLHPFMPFVTEEIWKLLPHQGDSIMVSKFPETDNDLIYQSAECDMKTIMAAIKGIRNIKSEMHIPIKQQVCIYVLTDEIELFNKGMVFIKKMTGSSEVKFIREKSEAPPNFVLVITDKAEIFLSLDERLDIKKEIDRLNKKKKCLELQIMEIVDKLNNKNFLERAPKSIVEKERSKEEKYRRTLNKLVKNIGSLKLSDEFE